MNFQLFQVILHLVPTNQLKSIIMILLLHTMVFVGYNNYKMSSYSGKRCITLIISIWFLDFSLSLPLYWLFGLITSLNLLFL